MDFSEIEEMRRESMRHGEAARLTNDQGVHPEIGSCYTISPDFVCGDRSYTDSVWRVIAANHGHVKVRHAGGAKPYRETLILTISERHWYPADDFAEAVE